MRVITLTKAQLKDKQAFVKRYLGKGNNASLSEVDPNSNVSHKTIATMEGEVNKDVHVQMNRHILGEKIKEVFGKKAMKQYYKDLNSHLIYKNDESSLKPYCVALSLIPFLEKGASALAGDSKAPKHLASFCGSYVNLMYALSGQFSGAIAEVSLLFYFHYFAKKDYGDNYLHTHGKEIENYFQQLVYSINSPAGARNHQSIFYNTSIWDRYYYDAMFGGAVYPDGSIPIYDEFHKLQKFFMNWFGEERHKALLTFPVITCCYLTKDGKPRDEAFVDFLAEQLEKGHSFFHYQSDKASALSSCCFVGDQKVLVRRQKTGIRETTFQDLWDNRYNEFDLNYQVFHNGNWVRGKLLQLDGKQLYRITTVNKKVITVTEDHLNPTIRGDLRADELTENDYLMVSTRPAQTFPEIDKGLTYEEGFLIGMYLGDGSMDVSSDGEEASVQLSLNESKYKQCLPYMEKAVSLIDNGVSVTLGKEYNNVYPVRIGSRRVVSFIREYVTGKYCNEKQLNLEVLTQSLDFRKGIADGIYATDGGNSNRIHTTSVGLVDDLEALFTSMGIQTIIDKNDRTNEPVVIRGETFKRNFPVYCVRWYSQTNRRNYANLFKTTNNSTYFKIAEIEMLEETPEYVYCFEMENEEEPYFTLPNGVITHNCRLRNEVEMNQFAYSLGGTGMMTGSLSVMTLNVNHAIQKKVNIRKKVQEMHRYLIAFRMLIQEFKDAGILPAYDEGYIDIEKQYITIGLNGIVEAAEYLGYEISNNDPYKEWLQELLGTVSSANRESAKYYTNMLGKKVLINSEMIPAENVGVKFRKWDTERGITSKRECYNSYFYIVEDEEIDIFDKFALHGGDILQYLDGGSCLHLNLDELPNKETWKKIINIAIENGTSYWTSNVKSTCCDDCGYINMHTKDSCIKCGSTNVSYATRVIGYLKKIKSFSKDRQIEAKKRHYHIDNK